MRIDCIIIQWFLVSFFFPIKLLLEMQVNEVHFKYLTILLVNYTSMKKKIFF